MAIVATAVIVLLTVVIITVVLMQRRYASPEHRYRRDLRTYRLIQKGIRPVNLDGTIESNSDASYGYDGR